MFKNILVPTDGSELSMETSRQAVAFARFIGARITAYHALPNMASAFGYFYDEGSSSDRATQQQLESLIDKEARKHLDFVVKLCEDAGVHCDNLSSHDDNPHEAILSAAKRSGADLIFMASHGRKGLKARLIGSETMNVLTHSPIPVLVYRWGDGPVVRENAAR
jgi:nucleotide-binding universal stress UspA family protein